MINTDDQAALVAEIAENLESVRDSSQSRILPSDPSLQLLDRAVSMLTQQAEMTKQVLEAMRHCVKFEPGNEYELGKNNVAYQVIGILTSTEGAQDAAGY